MEIRDYAERVLLGTTLKEKLAIPNVTLTDACRGQAVPVPDKPGRPDSLQFPRLGERTPMPSVTELNDEEDRGVLLHFFGNHELLAAELMALVLLRFPEAPAEFRRGVAETLREEQTHALLYIRRMEACGVTFGSQPVNSFFWRAVSSMQTPVDYVAGLSLTFEQANLDYSRHFARVFQQCGDHATARILDKIYHDEISHVGYGLQWFRHWKSPKRSDWASYESQLALPLSPSRAKGIGVFNREGRLSAGLSEEFVDELEVYARSKGRTPHVYYFNPQAEWSIATGQVLMPSGPLRQLAEDLSSLTLYLGKHDDVALMKRKPRRVFLRQLSELGIALPEIQELSNLDLGERKLGALKPWAWSPDSEAFLKPFFTSCSQKQLGWHVEWRELHSKVFSTALFEDCGIVCTTLEATRAALVGSSVLKSPYGLAGKGLRFLKEPTLSAQDTTWVRDVFEGEGAVVVEPWLDRVFDFSVQYEVEADGVMRLLGYTQLHNDLHGKFQGCSVGRTPIDGCDVPGLAEFFYADNRAVQRTYEQTLPELLGPHLQRLKFMGALGVDAMIHRDADGVLQHRPVIEINPRSTMGRVAIDLARQVVKGVPMTFQILTRKHLRKSQHTEWVDLAQELQAIHPMQVTHYQNNHRRIRSGCLILNDPEHVQGYLAVILVGQTDHPLLLP